MRTHLTESLRCLALACAVVLGMAGRALAIEGVIEINQARAQAGGVTPSDTPGFPVTIDTPGSYRLTGNLTPPGGTDAILITTDHVTVDLNGFAILGCVPVPPALCIARPDTGVNADGRSNITLVNGTVRGMGSGGIIAGANSRVERIRAISNGSSGISSGAFSLVTGNTASQNGGNGLDVGSGTTVTGNSVRGNGVNGIFCSTTCTVTGNLAEENGSDGISAGDVGLNRRGDSAVSGNTVSFNNGDGIECGTGCSVVGNAASSNAGLGLRLGSTAGYVHNVLTFNSGGNANPQASGGIQMGANVCGTALCP